MDLAKVHPTQYDSTILNGTDHSAFGLPHCVTSTKDDWGKALKERFVELPKHANPHKLKLFTMMEEYETADHVTETLNLFFKLQGKVGSIAGYGVRWVWKLYAN